MLAARKMLKEQPQKEITPGQEKKIHDYATEHAELLKKIEKLTTSDLVPTFEGIGMHLSDFLKNMFNDVYSKAAEGTPEDFKEVMLQNCGVMIRLVGAAISRVVIPIYKELTKFKTFEGGRTRDALYKLFAILNRFTEVKNGLDRRSFVNTKKDVSFFTEEKNPVLGKEFVAFIGMLSGKGSKFMEIYAKVIGMVKLDEHGNHPNPEMDSEEENDESDDDHDAKDDFKNTLDQMLFFVRSFISLTLIKIDLAFNDGKSHRPEEFVDFIRCFSFKNYEITVEYVGTDAEKARAGRKIAKQESGKKEENGESSHATPSTPRSRPKPSVKRNDGSK